MMHLMGAVCVAVGAVWLGLGAAAELGQRVRAVAAVSDGLELLERELCDRGTPLPELLGQLAKRTQEPVQGLFDRCAKACEQLDQISFGESWRMEVGGMEGLSRESRAALSSLGEVLGRYEADGQQEALGRVRTALEREQLRAEQERGRMGRVYQVLGLSGGVFLVILLL